MQKYESHITYNREYLPVAKTIGDLYGWKWSAIDLDPIMGDKSYGYLTAYDPDPINLQCRMKIVAGALRLNGIDVLREKIERIVYDTKTNVDELSHG